MFSNSDKDDKYILSFYTKTLIENLELRHKNDNIKKGTISMNGLNYV